MKTANIKNQAKKLNNPYPIEGYGTQKIRWISKSIYVDVETGEILDKSEWGNYKVIKKTKTYDVNNKQGVITYTNACRRTQYRQQGIW